MRKFLIAVILFDILNTFTYSQKNENIETVNTNSLASGATISMEFVKGKSHNKPSFAIWVETNDGKYIQTLFLTNSVNKGNYKYGKNIQGKWHASFKDYPASLPYWMHKSEKADNKKKVLEADAVTGATKKPDYHIPALVPDAYSGATPKSSFILNTKTDDKQNRKFRIFLEVNQTWDCNDYWHNAKYPDEPDYKSSCQPALIYAVDVDLDNLLESYILNPIGHSHFSGKDGNLYTDLSSLTTAIQIFDKIIVRIKT